MDRKHLRIQLFVILVVAVAAAVFSSSASARLYMDDRYDPSLVSQVPAGNTDSGEDRGDVPIDRCGSWSRALRGRRGIAIFCATASRRHVSN